jgi:fructokinase
MRTDRPVVVGLGELLWDLLPTGAHLGGAPSNFAYIASLLGAESVVVSRIGTDDLGDKARRTLQEHGLDVTFLQTDDQYSTGTVNVHLAADGIANYEIVENVAWDHLQWTTKLEQIARRADAVCFGTLVQRSAESRECVQRFLDHTRPDCLKIFDVNLRPPFANASIVRQSLARADVLKLNHEEVPEVLIYCSLPEAEDEAAARALQQRFSLKAVCITRGPNGSVIYAPDHVHVHAGVAVKVADTIGAGDAFTAGLAIQLLRNESISSVSAAANGIGSWVASQNGAMPVVSPAERSRLRTAFGVPDAAL